MTIRSRSPISGAVDLETTDHVCSPNGRAMTDIPIDFYKHRTSTLLAVSVLGLIYYAFTRNDDNFESNVTTSFAAVVCCALVVCVLAFSNRPLTWSRAAIWRVVFGVCVLYLMLLVFVLYQSHETVKEMMYWFFPELRSWKQPDKVYNANCSDVTLERIWDDVDVYWFTHFLGNLIRALIVRHAGVCWTISITWELTEMSFAHLLPVFSECWWDSFIVDLLLNGLGIAFGMFICRMMKMRIYHWESIEEIRVTARKAQSTEVQCTRTSWSAIRWLHMRNSYVAVNVAVLGLNLGDLNHFFLQHIFVLDTAHPLFVIRQLLFTFAAVPAAGLYYSYTTDTQCQHVGMHFWVTCVLVMAEAVVCFKFGKDLFQHTVMGYVIACLVITIISSVTCVYICAVMARKSKVLTSGGQ